MTAFVAASLLLVVAYVWMLCTPWQWFRELRPLLETPLDSPFMPGKRLIVVLLLALPVVLSAAAAGAGAARRPVLKMAWSERSCDMVALASWAALQAVWHIARLQRFGLDVGSAHSFHHVATTFGLAAMINLQLLLLPVTRGSLLSALLLGIPSERLVRWHRFLGQATVVFAVVHAAVFLAAWSATGELLAKAVAWPELLGKVRAPVAHPRTARSPRCARPCLRLAPAPWPTGDLFAALISQAKIAVLPGEIGLVAAVGLYVSSRPAVRRRSFELFQRAHWLFSSLMFVCVQLHWAGFVWYVLPGVVLYATDAVLERADAAGCSARLVGARYAHGVLTLWLRNSPRRIESRRRPALASALLRAPEALQWLRLRAPAVSRWQWHPFSAVAVREGGADYALCIKPQRGGWTSQLHHRLATSGCATPVEVGGWFGLGFPFDQLLHTPVCLVAGGSGGVPLAAVFGGLVERRRALGVPTARLAPLTLIWVCRRRAELLEYLQLVRPEIAEISARDGVQVHAYLTGAGGVEAEVEATAAATAEEATAEAAAEEAAAGAAAGAGAEAAWEVHVSAGEGKSDELPLLPPGGGPRAARWRRLAAPPLVMLASAVGAMGAAGQVANPASNGMTNPAVALLLGLLAGLAIGSALIHAIVRGPRVASLAAAHGLASGCAHLRATLGVRPLRMPFRPSRARTTATGLRATELTWATQSAHPPSTGLPSVLTDPAGACGHTPALAYHDGRPDISTVVNDFVALCDRRAAAEGGGSSAELFVSGPASLVAAVREAARARGRRVRLHTVSFEL